MTFIPLDLSLAKACEATYGYTDPKPTPTFQDEAQTVHVYLSEIDGVHTLAWEGTTDFQEWLIDFMALEVPALDHPQLGPVHLGFYRDVEAVLPAIQKYLSDLGWPPYYSAGHSKGSGEALLFHAVMKSIGHPPVMTRAFEAPCVGSSIMRDYLADQDILQTATFNAEGTDIVTLVPFGPTWVDMRAPIRLQVPDTYEIPQKHKIPAVIEAMEKDLAAP